MLAIKFELRPEASWSSRLWGCSRPEGGRTRGTARIGYCKARRRGRVVRVARIGGREIHRNGAAGRTFVHVVEKLLAIDVGVGVEGSGNWGTIEIHCSGHKWPWGIRL